jgi:hypothetical protein
MFEMDDDPMDVDRAMDELYHTPEEAAAVSPTGDVEPVETDEELMFRPL